MSCGYTVLQVAEDSTWFDFQVAEETVVIHFECSLCRCLAGLSSAVLLSEWLGMHVYFYDSVSVLGKSFTF